MSTPTNPKVTAVQGWSQLQGTMGRKMPDRLQASQRARQGLRGLMRGRGH